MRQLHDSLKWRNRPLVSPPGRSGKRSKSPDDRRFNGISERWRVAPSDPAGIFGKTWFPVRLLHVGFFDNRLRASQREFLSFRRRDTPALERQHLPLHRLSEYCRGCHVGSGTSACEFRVVMAPHCSQFLQVSLPGIDLVMLLSNFWMFIIKV